MVKGWTDRVDATDEGSRTLGSIAEQVAPHEELLHNVDEVETLLQDPVVLAAIHRLSDPDADLDKLRVSALY